MKKLLIAMSLPLIFQLTAEARSKTIVGSLQTVSGNSYVLQNGTETTPIAFTGATAQSIPSLVGKAPFVEINNFVLEDGVFKTAQVPTIISGNKTLSGILEMRNQSGRAVFTLGGKPATFAASKKINGTEFDEKSRSYFVGKKVVAEGVEYDGVFKIESILRDDIISAKNQNMADTGISRDLMTALTQQPLATAVGMINGTVTSPSPLWLRKTLFADAKAAADAQPGKAVLIITASGAQSDDAGAVNGHFAAGLGYVDQDLNIRGEMFNVYVTNEKEIVPGNINMIDYYGHLVSGQQNFRPTYTLVLYGIPEEKILKVKAELDRFHPLFRSGNTKITPNKNCATLTVQALADINIYGEQRNGAKNEFPILSQQSGFPPELSFLQELDFVAKTKRAEFMPGPAFRSILENLEYLNKSEAAGISRADFIFGGQTPSARKVGKAPTSGIVSQMQKGVTVKTGLMVSGVLK